MFTWSKTAEHVSLKLQNYFSYDLQTMSSMRCVLSPSLSALGKTSGAFAAPAFASNTLPIAPISPAEPH